MNKKGFTLIELMIVVVIIGILAAIAIPNFISMQDRAKEGSVKANMHTTQLAAEDYAVKNVGNYAGDATSAATLFTTQGSDIPQNPFTGADGVMNNIVAAGNQGMVGYNHDAYGSDNYSISGCGKTAVLTNPDGTTFILSNQN